MSDIIDISYFNTVTDWQKVKASVDAVVIRLGYRGYSKGTLAYDKSYAAFRKAVEQFNIPHSFYFFPCSVNEAEANQEADFIIQALAGADLALPVFLDSEIAEVKNKSGRSDKLSRADRTRFLAIICERLQAAGIPAGVYASTSWLNNQLDMSKLPYTVWVAQYNTKCTYKGSYLLWQYSSKGQIPGIKGNVDCSRLVNVQDVSFPLPGYEVGKTYRLKVNLYVRETANGDKKKFSALSSNARANGYADAQGFGILKTGTAVTCKELTTVNGALWMKIPSGWICAKTAAGKVYVS